MSHVGEKTFLQKLAGTRSLRSLAQNYLLGTMAGQKLFLYNQHLPRVINISFNEKTCMFACKMCPFAENHVREMYREGSEMHEETMRNIVASIPNDSCYSFDMSSIGETLQFEALPEYIAYMKRERPLVNTIVSTNGVLLTESVFRRLVESGLDSLQISLFAENEQDHRMITNSGSFERVCENIRAASRIKSEMKSTKPYIQTFLMECQETADKVKQFIDYWAHYVDGVFARPLYNVGRKIEGMTPCQDQLVPAKRFPCITPWYSTAIRSNGDVLHCYMFHWHEESKNLTIGNIYEKPLIEIWKTPEFIKFRKAHLSQNLECYPVCQACDLWAAYTNIWEEANERFCYSKVQPADFIKIALQHRGG